MSFSSRSTQKKGLRVWFFFFILITSISFILSLLVNPFWWILLLLSFFIFIITQLMSRYFWLEEKVCPRCNAPTGKYSEFCRNCGFKLFFRCISCGKYMRAGAQFCDNCNIELEHTEEEKESLEYPIVEKSSPLPEIPNFCEKPICGLILYTMNFDSYCKACFYIC